MSETPWSPEWVKSVGAMAQEAAPQIDHRMLEILRDVPATPFRIRKKIGNGLNPVMPWEVEFNLETGGELITRGIRVFCAWNEAMAWTDVKVRECFPQAD